MTEPGPSVVAGDFRKPFVGYLPGYLAENEQTAPGPPSERVYNQLLLDRWQALLDSPESCDGNRAFGVCERLYKLTAKRRPGLTSAPRRVRLVRSSPLEGVGLAVDSGADIPPHSSSQLVLDLGERTPPLVVVRRWAAVALADLSDEVLGDVLLVVTELVTNAYDHGVFASEVRLFRTGEPCTVRIEVDDTSPARPVIGRSRINGHRGRGLVIVDRLSKDWGVIPNVVGKTVWAEVACGIC